MLYKVPHFDSFVETKKVHEGAYEYGSVTNLGPGQTHSIKLSTLFGSIEPSSPSQLRSNEHFN